MIEVLINWLFISITSYALGFIVLKGLARLLLIDVKTVKNANIYRILLGLAIVTAYSEIWSLFGSVSAIADCVLIVATLLIIFLNKNDIGKMLATKPSIQTTAYIFMILVFAYSTSRGYMHFDTNLYHAQAIRWIEEYGVVPGLANLQSRFGYNSAEFALNALYSCKWCLGRSLHCTAGYFALISSFLLIDIKNIIIKNDNNKYELNIRVSDFVRIGLFFYLVTIYSEMISPASDYYAQLLIFDIVILWLDVINTEEERSLQGILCIILVYAITIKLSLGLLVLLALIPGIAWIKNKNIKSIITCVISGLIISIPYFIRNYIISGWILYPSTIIKLGSADWQVPIGEAKYDAKEIGMWGRGITNALEWDSVTLTNWIPSWFNSLSTVERILVIGDLVAFIFAVAIIIKALFARKSNQYQYLIFILAIGTVFWFVSAPLIRYGYAYVLILPLINLGYFMTQSNNEIRQIHIANTVSFASFSFVILALGIVAVKGKDLIGNIARTIEYPYYIHQQDYIDGEATTYTIDGITIYVAEDAGQIGYYKFPASPEVKTDIKLRGDDLSSGFMKQ